MKLGHGRPSSASAEAEQVRGAVVWQTQPGSDHVNISKHQEIATLSKAAV